MPMGGGYGSGAGGGLNFDTPGQNQGPVSERQIPRAYFGFDSHPKPKNIAIFDSTTFGSSVTDQPRFQYAPSDPIDFMRYRMGKTWYSVSGYNEGTMNHPENFGPLILARHTPEYNNQGTPYQYHGDISSTPGMFEFTRKETFTIEPKPSDLEACGNLPEPPLDDLNKWRKILDSTMRPHGINSHGIISTFSKLQRIEGQNHSSIEFYDHVMAYDVPLDKKNVTDNNYGAVKVFQAEVKPVYNFFIQSYESILTKNEPALSPPESILPSLYSFLSVMQNENNKLTVDQSGQVNPDTIFERHITLDGIIQGSRIYKEVTTKSGDRTETEISKGQYFDKYSYAFATQVRDASPPSWDVVGGANTVSLADRFKNQIVPTSNLELFSTFNDVVNRFPMYCDINFSTDSQNNKVLRLLEETILTTTFIKDFIDEKFDKSSMDFNFLSAHGLPFKPENYKESPFKFNKDAPADLFASGTLNCWDVTKWAETLADRNLQGDIYTNVEKGVFLGKYDEEVMMANQSPLAQMTNALMILTFAAKFDDLVKTETRTWKEIVGGSWPIDLQGSVSDWETLAPKKAYHETIFYKVEKWEARANGTVVGNEPLQNFYFPNSTMIQEHNFTDTQVKYGKRYIYRIYAYEMVFGTKYKYQGDAWPNGSLVLSDHNIEANQARICVISEPSIKLIKTPYYSKQIVMMDNPPIWPDVDIIPYRGVENKLLFWLKGNIGDYKLKPVIIQDTDQEIIDEIRVAQDLGPEEPVRFKSDDQAQFFEVFRLERKPNKYADFIGSKIAHIDTSVNIDEQCKSSTSGEWIDSIKPNQIYYYIFRSVDNHGHVSNPSPVYEMEMVHDGYAPFLLRKVYFLEDSVGAPQVAAKKFTKYIYIKPAFAQRLLNKRASGLLNRSGGPFCDTGACLTNDPRDPPKLVGNWVQLGTEDQALWGKKMKIRIISKKTGKRVDLNIKFKHEHLPPARPTIEKINLC